MPAGGATVRRWTLRENRSRDEAEAPAFRQWVLSLPLIREVRSSVGGGKRPSKNTPIPDNIGFQGGGYTTSRKPSAGDIASLPT